MHVDVSYILVQSIFLNPSLIFFNQSLYKTMKKKDKKITRNGDPFNFLKVKFGGDCMKKNVYCVSQKMPHLVYWAQFWKGVN